MQNASRPYAYLPCSQKKFKWENFGWFFFALSPFGRVWFLGKFHGKKNKLKLVFVLIFETWKNLLVFFFSSQIWIQILSMLHNKKIFWVLESLTILFSVDKLWVNSNVGLCGAFEQIIFNFLAWFCTLPTQHYSAFSVENVKWKKNSVWCKSNGAPWENSALTFYSSFAAFQLMPRFVQPCSPDIYYILW